VLPACALLKNKIQRARSKVDKTPPRLGVRAKKKLPAIAVLDEAVSTVITTEMAILN